MFANKILFKYIHVWSCFKGFTVRNIMVQPEYNLDTYFHPVRWMVAGADANTDLL
jgi:hypothetical protein